MGICSFDVGERVVIRQDLKHEQYGGLYCNAIMISYRGKEATIVKRFRNRKFDGEYEYYIDVDNGKFLWNDEMLMPCDTDADIEDDGSFEEFFSGFVRKNTATWIN